MCRHQGLGCLALLLLNAGLASGRHGATWEGLPWLPDDRSCPRCLEESLHHEKMSLAASLSE